MKKVKKSDLRSLIWNNYLNMVRHIPIFKTGNQPFDMIRIDVNSVCINVYDNKEFLSEENHMECLKNLATHIEALTFGNLKVINMGCEKGEDWYLTWMNIACAYEIAE